ncbi:hypothetical protein BCR42DRAFT_400568, partial [Absidia repens]
MMTPFSKLYHTSSFNMRNKAALSSFEMFADKKKPMWSSSVNPFTVKSFGTCCRVHSLSPLIELL